MNRICLVGRLVRDPELRYSASGVGICSFTLAIDRPFAKEGQQKTDFIMCKTLNKQAENCANYLAKGKMASVDGRLQINVSEKDGEKKYYTEVFAETVRFLSPKDAGSEFIAGEIEHSDDDLPF